jgi:hypothetical protein
VGEAAELSGPVYFGSVEFHSEVEVAYSVHIFSNIAYCEAKGYFNTDGNGKTLEEKMVATVGEILVNKNKLT